ncbi:MAG: hypothetical protein L0338_09345 [Acidobacteria bacterium]|nr:hypothetical protein [Acidobacteriota bacterium]
MYFWASDGKLAELAEEVRQLGHVKVARMESLETRKLFDPASIAFEDEVRAEAEGFFRRVGFEILEEYARKKNWPESEWESKRAKHAIGFGDDQLLVVYFYNVPTATVTLLWQQGSFNGKQWTPLFPTLKN